MALTLTVPSGTFHLSGNPLYVEISGAVIPTGATCYKLLCKVTSTDGVLIGGPFIDAKTPDETGKAIFDVSGYCDQPVEKEFEYPLVGLITPRDNDTLDMTFTPGESYIDADGELQENWVTPSDGNYVIKGGVGPGQLGAYNDNNSSFYADFVQGGKWLTHMPDFQVVHYNQPVKLWLCAAASGASILHIKAYYDDGTYYDYTNAPGLYENIMHEISCLPYHNQSEQMPARKSNGAWMTRYEVWIDGKTVKRTFVVDHSHHPQCNYLFALNSIGGVDCVWLSGEVQKGFKTESVQALRPFPREGRALDRTVIIAQRIGQRTWKIHTGWKLKAEIEALRDLLLSKQVWLLEDAPDYNSGTLCPVTVETSSAELYDSFKDLWSLEIELSEAHNSQYL
jgi:hypothetical protein